MLKVVCVAVVLIVAVYGGVVHKESESEELIPFEVTVHSNHIHPSTEVVSITTTTPNSPVEESEEEDDVSPPYYPQHFRLDYHMIDYCLDCIYTGYDEGKPKAVYAFPVKSSRYLLSNDDLRFSCLKFPLNLTEVRVPFVVTYMSRIFDCTSSFVLRPYQKFVKYTGANSLFWDSMIGSTFNEKIVYDTNLPPYLTAEMWNELRPLYNTTKEVLSLSTFPYRPLHGVTALIYKWIPTWLSL